MPVTRQEDLEKVQDIVKSDLSRYYHGRFSVVARGPEQILIDDDEQYLRIYIVFDGKARDLRIPEWTQGLISRIRDKLSNEGINEFPLIAPVAESEWKSAEESP